MRNVVELVLMWLLALIFAAELTGFMVALAAGVHSENACAQNEIYVQCYRCCSQPETGSYLSSCESVCTNLGQHECTEPKSIGCLMEDDWAYEEALRSFDKAIELNPNLARAWYEKGSVLRALGCNAEAESAFVKAKKLGYTCPI